MIAARDYYYLTYASIQKDVMTYGPIEASMDVYDDFPSYKSGKSAFIWMNYRSKIFFNFFFKKIRYQPLFLGKQTLYICPY